jgi:hypothetical protein
MVTLNNSFDSEITYDLELQNKINLAWAAGFIDGEGCIHIIRQPYGKDRKINYRLRMHIAQANLEVLELLKEFIGVHGVIHKLRRGLSTNKQVYALHYDGRHALDAIERVKPYLIRKLYEAKAAKLFWEEGKLDLRTGRKPVPEDLMNIREKWCMKMQKLK